MTTPTPGTVYDTGVATLGGRGQQAVVPYPHVRHILTMTTTMTSTHDDHHVTAEEAITERIGRLKDMHIPYVRDGLRLSYTGHGGAHITLEYQEPRP